MSSSAKGATLQVAPELADAVGPFEVGEHEDVEQLGAGSRTEGVEAFSESALELIGTHGREATPSDCRGIGSSERFSYTFSNE
jgi:hypothetical protein